MCSAACAAHDFQHKIWRHLNFFQHHCYIHASVPRVKCPDHGVELIDVPWARKGSPEGASVPGSEKARALVDPGGSGTAAQGTTSPSGRLAAFSLATGLRQRNVSVLR